MMKTQTLPKNDTPSPAHPDTSNSVDTQLSKLEEREYPIYSYVYDVDKQKITELRFTHHPYAQPEAITYFTKFLEEAEHAKIFRNPKYVYLYSDFEKKGDWQIMGMMPLDQVHHFTDDQYEDYFTSCGGDEAFEDYVKLPNPDIRWHLVSHLVCTFAPHLIDLEKLDLPVVYANHTKMMGKSALQIKNHFLKRFI